MITNFKVLSLTDADLIAIDEGVSTDNGIKPLSEKELAEWCEWIKVNPKITYPVQCEHSAKQCIYVGDNLNGRMFEVLYVKDGYAVDCQCSTHEYVEGGRLLFAYSPDKFSRFSEIWIRMVLPPTNRYENRLHFQG